MRNRGRLLMLGTLAAWAAAAAPAAGQREVPGETTQGGVLSLTFSPDGKRLAAGGLDATVWVWDLAKADEPAAATRLGKTVRGVAFAPDGNTVAALTDGGLVTLLDAGTGRAVREVQTPCAFGKVAFAPGGAAVAVGGFERPDGKGTRAVVHLFDARTGKGQWTARPDDPAVLDVAFAPGGKAVATLGTKGVTVWDPATGDRRRTLDPGPGVVEGMGFGPGLVVATAGKGVVGWDPDTGKETVRADGHGDRAVCVAVSPDGRRVASGGMSDLRVAGRFSGACVQVSIRDVGTGKEVARYDPGPDEFGVARAVAYAPDGKALAVATDFRLFLLDPESGKPGRLLLKTFGRPRP